MSELSLCKICGEPMPEGEEMFFYHGLSGPCPVGAKKEKTAVIGEMEFLQKLIDGEERMADTCNLEHPNYEGSDEQSAYRMHQLNIVMLEKIKQRITELEQQLKTAKADAVREAARVLPYYKPNAKVNRNYISKSDLLEYANNLEGK